MAVSTLPPTTAATATTGTTTSASQQASKDLAGTFNTFLTLLTAQLQNQDPLSPVDSEQFTQQLVQFSQVEQQIRANENLETLISQNQASAAALPLAYLGHSAVIQTSASALATSGDARWTYSFDQTPASVTLAVKDASGHVVHTETGAAAAGAHNFSWNGQLDNGQRAPQGVYTLSIDARDDQGASIKSEIHVIETVSGVDLTGTPPRVLTASGLHDLADVHGVYD